MAKFLSTEWIDRTITEDFDGNQWIEYLRGKYQWAANIILDNFGNGHILEEPNGLEQESED